MKKIFFGEGGRGGDGAGLSGDPPSQKILNNYISTIFVTAAL
jgi:hypothetical protein